MQRKTFMLAGLVLLQLVAMLSTAFAKCTPKQYIDYGRAGLSDAQIQKKCNDLIPQWLSGQWAVTLKLEHFRIHDKTAQQDIDFNPFSRFAKGMESFAQLADKPDDQRQETWLLTSANGHLTLNRLYNPKYNPDSPAFARQTGQQQSRHILVKAERLQNHLKMAISSPPYGNLGIEQWQFDIDLNGNLGRKDQLTGHYRVSRKNLLDGKLYTHDGLVIMIRTIQ